MISVNEKLHHLCTLLSRGRFRMADELKCQDDIQSLLSSLGVPFIREYQTSKGTIDFYLPNSRIAIEVKASKRWSKTEVYRQCERYAEVDEVDGVLLATAKAQGLPEFAKNGKPLFVFLLSTTALY